ncbi:type VI secretion system protein TssL, long form [Paraburkholderia sediminicola]|uniref:type VI secretion system protein TssL, long form n=1 Tax=Paraburkholderia sediminicola TaxID=458836 RepID=UPI0038B84AE2
MDSSSGEAPAATGSGKSGNVWPVSAAQDTPTLPSHSSANNLLVAAANALLDTLAQIRFSTHLTPERLREYLVDEIRQFQTRAQQAAISIETIVGARYCLCTALDEAAALAPWGGGTWSTHSLLVAFHNETWGGEKFFQLLARLSTHPREHRNIIELQYFCLVLGFQGRYRVVQNGAAQLETLTRRLHKLLHETGGGYAQPLSPNWRAADRTSALTVRRWLPPWTWLLFASLVGCASFIGFLVASSAHADRTHGAINAIHLPAISERTSTAQPANLAQLLDVEVRNGALVVHDEADRSVIAIRGDGLFDSGSAAANTAYLPMLAHIAGVLNRLDGDVVITGYTDNQPIRDRRFASNLALSQARATAIRQSLLAAGFDRTRSLTVAGRGDEQPVDTNQTAEGRAHNRRVEIVLFPVLAGKHALSQASSR